MKNENLERALEIKKEIEVLEKHFSDVYHHYDGGAVLLADYTDAEITVKPIDHPGCDSPTHRVLIPKFYPIDFEIFMSQYMQKIKENIAKLEREFELL